MVQVNRPILKPGGKPFSLGREPSYSKPHDCISFYVNPRGGLFLSIRQRLLTNRGARTRCSFWHTWITISVNVCRRTPTRQQHSSVYIVTLQSLVSQYKCNRLYRTCYRSYIFWQSVFSMISRWNYSGFLFQQLEHSKMLELQWLDTAR
jgi:hypothetical protein